MSVGLLTLYLLLPSYASAQELTYFALGAPGQGSLALSKADGTAFILDLGYAESGRSLRLDGERLLDFLETSQVKTLVISCSHPHADHLGGLLALVKEPKNFVSKQRPSQPRFERVFLIDSAPGLDEKKSLGKTVKATLNATKIAASSLPKFEFRVGWQNPKVYDGIATAKAQISVENITHSSSGSSEPHVRALVTLTTIEGKLRLLDTDDAVSNVIAEVAKKVGKVDIVTLPHHGSKYTDIGPLLALGISQVIISVAPDNRFDHPGLRNLLAAVKTVGAANVYFTGSVRHLKVTRAGLPAQDPVTVRDNFETYIRPRKAAVEAELAKTNSNKKEIKKSRALLDELAQIAQLEQLMVRPAVGTCAEVRSASAAFAAGILRAESVDQTSLRRRIGEDAKSLTLPLAPDETVPETALDLTVAQQVRLLDALSLNWFAQEALTAGGRVTVFSQEVDAPTARPLELFDLTSANFTAFKSLRAAPSGGMVYFNGGRVSLSGPHSDLVGASLDVCDAGPCLVAAGGKQYQVPLQLDSLFAEVWDRAYSRNLDAFYLTIDPLQSALTGNASAAPSDRLRLGGSELSEAERRNIVRTAGDIDRTAIGHVLLAADVLFKSRALGIDVVTGAAAPSKVRAAAPTEPGWCRFYWDSGAIEFRLEGNRVQVSGAPVVAHAEAMVVRDGQLTPRPSGGWCKDAIRVAQQLNLEVRSTKLLTPTLKNLVKIASAQAFSKWVLESRIVPTPAFLSDLARKRPKSTAPLPQWTTGIRKVSTTAVEVHGGVLLLGARRPLSADGQLTPRDEVLLPDGRPVFRAERDMLHFWSMPQVDADGACQSGEHLAISSAKILDQYGSRQGITFLLQTQPGTSALAEGRPGCTKDFEKNAVWKQDIDLNDGALSRGCLTTAEGNTCFSDILPPELGARQIAVNPLDATHLLVRVDLSWMQADIAQRAKQASTGEITDQLRFIETSANLGFQTESKTVFLSLQRDIKTVAADHQLIPHLLPLFLTRQDFRGHTSVGTWSGDTFASDDPIFYFRIAQSRLLSAVESDAPVAAVTEAQETFERFLRRLPRPVSALVEDELRMDLLDLSDTAKPERRARIQDLAERYGSLARLDAALAADDIADEDSSSGATCERISPASTATQLEALARTIASEKPPVCDGGPCTIEVEGATRLELKKSDVDRVVSVFVAAQATGASFAGVRLRVPDNLLTGVAADRLRFVLDKIRRLEFAIGELLPHGFEALVLRGIPPSPSILAIESAKRTLSKTIRRLFMLGAPSLDPAAAYEDTQQRVMKVYSASEEVLPGDELRSNWSEIEAGEGRKFTYSRFFVPTRTLPDQIGTRLKNGPWPIMHPECTFTSAWWFEHVVWQILVREWQSLKFAHPMSMAWYPENYRQFGPP